MEQKKKNEKRKDFMLNKKKQARINLIMHLKKSSCKQQKNLTYSMNNLQTEGAHVAYKTVYFHWYCKDNSQLSGCDCWTYTSRKPENNFLHIVVDPGTRQFESTINELFYTLL